MPKLSVRRHVLPPAVLATLLIGGCESHDTVALDPVVHTPLALDPTEDFELAAWWVSDDHLLFLNDAGHYRLYEGTSRYRPPVERGLWSRANYATLRLQPYSSGTTAMFKRGKLARTAEGLSLSLPDLAPLSPRTIPPRAVEDELLGSWSGSEATLVLREDMQFSFTSRHLNAAPVRSTTRHGTWRYGEDGDVILGADELRFRIERNDADEITILRGPHLELTRPIASRT